MAKNLNGIPFTCENRRFATNTTMGFPHGAGRALGSVIADPLISAASNGGYSLWIEYLTDAHETMTTNDCFWLMWYDAAGRPTIPASGVFDKKGLAEMIAALTTKGLLP